MLDVAFVTTNRGKFLEARTLLRPYGVKLRWLPLRLSEPQADDLAEVARAKARSVPRTAGWVLVEDSGLFIPSLRGFPGVYSAHFLSIWGFPPILQLLRGRARGAVFRSVAALRQGRSIHLFTGEVHGTIARRPAGTTGFGYDPIFVPRGHRRTFAQLGPDLKNALSHRARSMTAAGEFLAGSRRPGRSRPGGRSVPRGRASGPAHPRGVIPRSR